MDKDLVKILAAIMLDEYASAPQAIRANLSDPGRYDTAWNAAVRTAAKMQFALTMENKSAGELVFNQRASPPCKVDYWIRVSFSEAAAGADAEIKIICGQQTNNMDGDIFNDLIDPISRDHCDQMRKAIAKALVG